MSNPSDKEPEPKHDASKHDASKNEPPKPDREATRAGKFVQTYSGVLSTFVIGAAGLVASTTWQFKQSEIAKHQGESQAAIAKAQADNQWRIERAEILSKNLQILASRGEGTAEQRYGVLLSLTRGEILDPELAVSYALELGKDNPDYMKSVLSSTTDKDYQQLEHAFVPSCEQRFGITRQLDICKGDLLAPRSDAIATIISEDAEVWAVTGTPAPIASTGLAGSMSSPVLLLRDERRVQKDPGRLAWLFTPCISDLYLRKQWTELKHLEEVSTGAHLISALVVGRTRTGELGRVGGSDGAEQIHEAERTWLASYTLGKTCDDDCRARIADFMLSGMGDAMGDYDDLMRRLLRSPRAESGAAVERLHSRLIRCQVDQPDVEWFRDHVLVLGLGELLEKPAADSAGLENFIDLIALVPEPTDPVALTTWNSVEQRLAKAHPDKRKQLSDRRAVADTQQKNPPPVLRKVSFCHAPEVTTESWMEF